MPPRILLLFVFVSFVFAQDHHSSDNQFGAVDYLTTQQLRDYLTFIASDELQGRDTPSNGLNTAAKFITTLLSRWGVVPKGDNGTYFQSISLLKSVVRTNSSSVTLNGKSLTFGEEYICNAEETSITARLVYVNSGYVIPGKKIDPYKGIDVKGKVIVVLGGYPKGIQSADLYRLKKGIEYETPSTYAVKHGAVGIVVIPSPYALERWDRDAKKVSVSGEVTMLDLPSVIPQGISQITISLPVAEQLFASIHKSSNRDSLTVMPSFEFPSDVTITAKISVSLTKEKSQNIIGVLEGNDPKLKGEYVAFGAHYDHLGIGTPVNGDSIYNGADDDGSGTVAVLSMAEAFAKGKRPKRSLLFVWHCGEEKGLWGSKYFTDHPTVPLENIVTQLNIDMIGRSRPARGEGSDNTKVTGSNEIFVIGSTMMSTELGELSEKVNDSFLHMTFNYFYDNPNDPERLFYRSDHYNYAKHGIPIIFYFDGIHQDYHKVSDEVSKIDFEKYLKVTKTIFATGWTIANLPHRPIVNKVVQRHF